MPDFPFIGLRRSMPRRHFLRGAGVMLGLPMLDAMQRDKSTSEEIPRRMFAVCNNLGLLDMIQAPRSTGDVVVPFAVILSTLACVNSPPRTLS